MKRLGKIAAVLLGVCMIMCMAVGCGGLDGTFTMKETVDVDYGDTTLHMPYYWELTVEGDTYEMIMTVDISGGYAMCRGWTGKCSVDGNTVTCEKADKFFAYQATIETADDGTTSPKIDKTTKEETDAPAEGMGGAEKYTVDEKAGTFKRA